MVAERDERAPAFLALGIGDPRYAKRGQQHPPLGCLPVGLVGLGEQAGGGIELRERPVRPAQRYQGDSLREMPARPVARGGLVERREPPAEFELERREVEGERAARGERKRFGRREQPAAAGSSFPGLKRAVEASLRNSGRKISDSSGPARRALERVERPGRFVLPTEANEEPM